MSYSGHSFDPGEPAWLSFGSLQSLTNDSHIWLHVGTWLFLWPHQPSGFQLPKTVFTILCLSYKDKSNVSEEGWLPVFAAA